MKDKPNQSKYRITLQSPYHPEVEFISEGTLEGFREAWEKRSLLHFFKGQSEWIESVDMSKFSFIKIEELK